MRAAEEQLMGKKPDDALEGRDSDQGGQQPSDDPRTESPTGDLASKIDPDMGTPETHADPADPESTE